VEVTRTALDRLERLDLRLNAFMTSLGEQAPEAAKRAEQNLVAGQPRGPFGGQYKRCPSRGPTTVARVL
jgi:Asp-tRNA(Asn)/Glu-tRNA(Gln) amidotransferase A subunit family amidase